MVGSDYAAQCENLDGTACLKEHKDRSVNVYICKTAVTRSPGEEEPFNRFNSGGAVWRQLVEDAHNKHTIEQSKPALTKFRPAREVIECYLDGIGPDVKEPLTNGKRRRPAVQEEERELSVEERMLRDD